MKGITKEEWQEVVQALRRSPLPVPPSLIGDYDNWLCRSYAGRTFFTMGDYENAIMVLATVLDIQPDLEDKPQDGFSQAEHKVLCLLDMVEIIMALANNPTAALRYMDEVVAICEKFDGEFISANPEKIWQRRQELLRLAGQNEEQKTWQPKVKMQKREVLSIEEVRHRQSKGAAQGELLEGIKNILQAK